METAFTVSKARNTFYFKACPRCRGDMYKGQDIFGTYISCCQCGFEMSGQEPALKPISPRHSSMIHGELLQKSA